jgi:glycosyltransferase involved in cell wall biosynthesis
VFATKKSEKMVNALETDNKPVPTSPMPAGVLITVAICTRNRASFLEQAVCSVVPQMTGDAELLIVDNASTDNTPELAARLAAASPNVKVWREDELGLSVARNAALKLARGQFVLFLDDDAVAEPGWLAAYQRFLSAPPSEKIAVVGGAVFYKYEKPPPSWLNPDGVFDLGDSQKCLPYRDSPLGCNVAYFRKAALAVGMFDTQLGRKGEKMMCREESDLNLRLQDAGYEIWWLPDAAIRHVVHADRLNLRWVMYSAFKEGQSVAIQRLNGKKDRTHRALFHFRRLAAAPFHFAINLLAALFLWPFNRVKAVDLFKRSVMILGFACQLTKEIPRTIISTR